MDDPQHGTSGPAAVQPRVEASLEIKPLPAGLRAIGEISMSTQATWQQALEQLAQSRTATLHLDMAQVTFVDVAGVTDLAVVAQQIADDRRVVVHQPPPQLPRILEIFWPGLPTIEVAQR